MNAVLTSLKRHPFLCLAAIYAGVFLVNGFAAADLGDYLLISSDPFELRDRIDRQFLYSSPLNFMLAHVTGLGSFPGYFMFHAAEIMAMLCCVIAAIRKKIPVIEQQTRFIIFLSLTPLWLITLKWLGKTDPVLIGGLFLCWAFRTRWRILIAVVMVAAHREIGSLMALALYFLEDRKDGNLLVAVVIGNGLHLLYQYGLLNAVPQSRAEAALQDMKYYLVQFISTPAIYIISIFSWYWIAICLQKPTLKEGLVFIAAFLLTLPCADFTRIFILLALPALLFHVERFILSLPKGQSEKLAPLTLIHFHVAASVPYHSFDNMLTIALMKFVLSAFR